MIVTNDGIEVSRFFHSISPSDEAIKIPTVIKAGAVTADVTTDNNPEQNNISKKHNAVKTDVNPVRPPASTPVSDSTNEVVEDVPRTDPITVALESANKALSPLTKCPFWSTNPARVPTATKVPAVSKKSTNKNEKITGIISTVKILGNASNNAPNVGFKDGIGAIICVGKATTPKRIPTTAVTIIPIKMAAGVLRTNKTKVTINQQISVR